MKKLVAIIMTAILCISLASCGGNDDPNLIKIGDYQAVYTGSEIVKDYDGDDAIVVTLDYTNNSKEEESFEWAMYYTVTQGDSELEYTPIFVSEDSYDMLDENIRENVAPGESLEVKLTYKLSDSTTPVKIDFSNLLDTQKDSLTIDLTELSK